MSEMKTMPGGLGRDPDGSGSQASPEAASHLRHKGFDPSREHVRHLKRGSTYAVLNRTGLLQTDQPLVDGDMLVTYQGADGQWWHRPPHEFDLQGRFEPVPAPAIEAGTAETEGLGPKAESAITEGEAPINSLLLSALKAMDEALTEEWPGPEASGPQLGRAVCEAWIKLRSAITTAEAR